MRKIMFLILIAVLLLGTFAVYKAQADSPVPPCNRTISGPTGDVDGDGFVTENDGQWISEYLAGTRVIRNVPQLVGADVDGDNLITMYDAIKIIRYAQGMITKFPVCP